MTPGESLMARLGLDTTGFKAGMKEAHGAFKQFGGSLAGILSTVGLAAASRELIQYGAKVYDLSQRFGVTTDALQKFGNAAEENGSSLEGMAKGFNKLDIAISKALGGNAQMLKAFADLGVTVTDLRTMSPEEIMLKIGKSSMNAADMVKVLGKSALELRPTLAGLADGTIEFGEAIDTAMVAKLKEADKLWRQIWNNIRVVAANALGSIITEVKFITTGIAGMFSSMSTMVVADFQMIKAAAVGNFAEVKRQAQVIKDALRDFKESAFGARPETPGATPAGRTFSPTGTGEVKKSHSELEKEKKDRERDQLSLKELATEGAHYGISGGPSVGAWTGSQATGTIQMIFARQQAQLVEALEARAKRVRLTGISSTGESSADLLARADAIRQTLPIKETEKDVGIYRQAFKESLSGVEEKLDNIEAQLE